MTATRARVQLDGPRFIPRLLESQRSGAVNERLFGVATALVDAVIILLSGYIVLYMRFVAPSTAVSVASFWNNPDCHRHFGVIAVFATLTILTSDRSGLYELVHGASIIDEALSLAKAIAVAALMLTALLYFLKATQVSRLSVGVTAIVAFAALVTWRSVKRNLVRRQMVYGYGCRNVLIIGTGETARGLARYLDTTPQLGYKVCGYLDEHDRGGAGVLGRFTDFCSVAMANFIDEILITVPANDEAIRRLVIEAQERSIGVKVVPGWLEGLGRTRRVQQIGDFPVLCIHERHIPATSLALKRGIDIVFSLVALTLLAPVILAIAIVIKLDSRGTIIYRSKRVGRRGRTFDCYKFRTMVPDAERRQQELQSLNERNVILFKIRDDPRMTRVGRWLRKYSVDELPQFWNVLKGDMSVVGPRPPIPSEVQRYELEHLKRIDMTPGITGLWQITARCNPSFHYYIQCDLEYTANWSLGLDLKIMLKTIPVVLKGTGQ